MRLLSRGADGSYKITSFHKNIPRYAVLSHTWLDVDEEVTFQDLTTNTGHNKYGNKKIDFCAKQAKRDGLEYFWVDTCCIDKTSSAELSEAINSMYKWYKNALKCYVYLDDVGHDNTQTNEPTSSWMSELQSSRYFRRGWTLQELIVPEDVEFFDHGWRRLGTKKQLAEPVSTVTGIPASLLAGNSSINKYSVAQRMSWAANRKTTRVEDRAYSLLGLFDINMPLLYGEGHRAFQRLQEEIIKRTDDQSIFAWQLPSRYSTSGLFAPTPDAFKNAQHIVSCHNKGSTVPFGLTNRGLQIKTPIFRSLRNALYGTPLNCMDENTGARLGIYLTKVGPDQFLRTRLDLLPKFGIDPWAKNFKLLSTREIYVPQVSLVSYHPSSRLRLQRTLATSGPRADGSCSSYSSTKVIAAACGMCLGCPTRTNSRVRLYLRRYHLRPR